MKVCSKFSKGDIVLINSGMSDQGRLGSIDYVSNTNDSGDPDLNYYGVTINGETVSRGYHEKELIGVKMIFGEKGGGE